MFVCMGNICRSPLAHAVFDSIAKKNNAANIFETESSGTIAYHVGEPADARMTQTAATHGISIIHRARHFKREDLSNYDLILAMDHSNHSDIMGLADRKPEHARKVLMLRQFDPHGSEADDVPDPYYGGAMGFENVFQIVERSCRQLFKEIENGSLNP